MRATAERRLPKGTVWPLSASLLLFVQSAHAEDLAENQARFGQVSGEVLVLSQGASDWVDAHEGMPIEPGDEIHTDEASQAELIQSQDVLWLLTPETDVLQGHSETNGGHLTLTQGTVLGKVDTVHAGAAQRWTIETPMAVVAIRGTEFAVDFNKEEGARVGVFEGEVEVQPAETASGEQPAFRIRTNEEGALLRGKRVRVLNAWSPRLAAHAALRRELRARHARTQSTYSPYTITYRKEMRAKWVAPVHRRAPRPKVVRPRARRARAESRGY